MKFYRNLGSAAALIGLGMILGYNLSEGTSNTPIWIGGLLILLAAVLVGMSLSTPKPQAPSNPSTPTPEDSKPE